MGAGCGLEFRNSAHHSGADMTCACACGIIQPSAAVTVIAERPKDPPSTTHRTLSLSGDQNGHWRQNGTGSGYCALPSPAPARPAGACGRCDRSLWLQQPGDVLPDDLHLEVLGITGNRPSFGCSLAHVARPKAGHWQLDSHHASSRRRLRRAKGGETSKTPRPALTTTMPGEAPDYGWTELIRHRFGVRWRTR